MKKIHWVFSILLVGVFALTACGAQQGAKSNISTKGAKVSQTKRNSSKKQAVTKRTTRSSEQSSEVSTTTATSLAVEEVRTGNFWDEGKVQALNNFMQSWGTAMGQTYQNYTATRSVTFGGVNFPQDLLNGNTTLQVSGQPVETIWLPNGADEAAGSDYKIMAAFSDVTAATPDKQYAYLFAMHALVPTVLVATPTSDGAVLNASVTQNKDLQQAYSDIIQNSATDVVPEKVSLNSNSTSSALANYTAEQIQYAKVWLTFAKGSTDNYISALDVSHESAGSPVGNGRAAGAVGFPQAVTEIIAMPLAGGGITYADNGDGTITVYEVPLHFQDRRFMEPAFGKQFTQSLIEHAVTENVQSFTNEQLLTILEKMQF
jgi:predicted small secreted protein